MLCPKMDCLLKSCQGYASPDEQHRQPLAYNREASGFNDLGKFGGHMGIHIIVLGICWVRCIQVEASSSAKIPVIIFTLDPSAPWRCVWEQDGYALFSGWTKESAFLGSCNVWACQTVAPIKDIATIYPLSSVQVSPARYTSIGTFSHCACGGRYRLN
jgi:hypothetical protein